MIYPKYGSFTRGIRVIPLTLTLHKRSKGVPTILKKLLRVFTLIRVNSSFGPDDEGGIGTL